MTSSLLHSNISRLTCPLHGLNQRIVSTAGQTNRASTFRHAGTTIVVKTLVKLNNSSRSPLTWQFFNLAGGTMTGIRKVQKLFIVLAMALMLIAAVPTSSVGKDRNGRRWRGRDNRDDSSWFRRNRKCRKFRNCHDARDGRWDGRGPSGDRVSSIFRRNRRNRDRDRDVNRRWRNRNLDNGRVWRTRNR